MDITSNRVLYVFTTLIRIELNALRTGRNTLFSSEVKCNSKYFPEQLCGTLKFTFFPQSKYFQSNSGFFHYVFHIT